MTRATIDPKYSIGIEAMDIEHAHWIRLIEEFRAAATDHMTDQKGIAAAEATLEKLLAYTKDHFASELRYLESHQYPEVAAHMVKHHELEQEVAHLLQQIGQHKGRTTPLKLNLLVTVWLLDHIMTEDWKYARHILRQQKAAH